MAQVQCPNCGGYKVNTETAILDSKGRMRFSCGGVVFLTFFGIGGILTGIVFLGMGLSPEKNQPPVCLPIGFLELLFGIFFTVLLIYYIYSYFAASKVEEYHHTCLLCGYEWRRREGEPLPPVTVRPDLIAKGDQRLREEEAEEQARRTAWWIQQQQQKK